MPITINGSGTVTGISVGGLPDGIVDTDMLADDAVTSAKATGVGGITGVDAWRNTTSTGAGSQGDVTSNWARIDDGGFAKVGTGLSESSGIFSFPETGIWMVHWIYAAQPKADTKSHMSGAFTTDNGSNWDETALATVGFNDGDSSHSAINQGSAVHIFDVTSTTNCKFKFTLTSVGANSIGLTGASAYTYTGFTVIRLGDT